MSEDSSLRVLLIAHGLPPESVGGVEQHVDGLARALVAAGHQVQLWVKTGRAGLPQGAVIEDEDDDKPYRVARFVYRYEDLHSLADLYDVDLLNQALDAFLESRPAFDVAHVHHMTGVSTGLLEVLRAREIPSVLTLHDYWLMCPRGQMWHREGRVCETVEPQRCADCLRPAFGGWIPPGEHGVDRIAALHDEALALLGLPDQLVVPSARAIPPFEALGVPAERIEVVENAVDTEALGELAPPSADPARPLRIGYLGTLIPSKGLDVLVDAVQRLPAGSAELQVHGNAVPYHGDHSWLTGVLARLRPEDSFSYAGPYTTDDLPAILAELDLVVAPALWHEAFGLTVREALAAGRPIVVSRIGGLQDAIDDGVAGRIVPPGDPAALAEALEPLCRDRAELGRMAEAARRMPVRGFEAMAAELADLYRSL